MNENIIINSQMLNDTFAIMIASFIVGSLSCGIGICIGYNLRK
jgi:hypothetical protein